MLSHPISASLIGSPSVDRWIGVDPSGIVLVRTGKVELGQGLLTALAQIAAEELDVAIERVRLVSGDTVGPDEWYTAGSLSVEVAGAAIGAAASAARQILLMQAAHELDSTKTELTVADGAILRSGAPTTLTYWSLCSRVDFRVPVVAHAAVKDRATYRLVGSSAPRIDLEAKLGGGAFIQDLVFPNMLHGRVLRPPSARAALIDCDEAGLARLPGLVAYVRDGSFVGIVTEREAGCLAALTQAQGCLRWEASPVADPHEILAASNAPSETVYERGVFGPAERWVERTYARPFIAHASIGTSCALALWTEDGLHVWSHSQGVFALRDALARVFDLEPARVRVTHVAGAGCYGHNGADDAALDVALLARACPGRVVRVAWSREDELRWSPLGSAMQTTIRAGLGPDGAIVGFEIDVLSGPHGCRPGAQGGVNLLAATHFATPIPMPAFADFPASSGGGADRNAVPAYEAAGVRVQRRTVSNLPVRTSSLRALGAYANVFAIESLMDELAESLDEDPIEYRLRHLSDPRARSVVARTAELAGWPGPSGEGVGLGLGFARYKNKAAYCAVALKVEVEREVRVRRAWSVVDAGLVINPDGAAHQIEGGILQSLSWTLKEAVPFDETGVSARDWEGYPILSFEEVPELTVEFAAPAANPPLGVGEASQGPAAAAVANAVYRAIGVRLRATPFTRDRIAEAILT